jgi:sugar phosphate isomerase/epimerase
LPPLGIAHFSAIGAAPQEFAGLAAEIGYASIGLRLYPAFPGAPFYELPAGTEMIRCFRSCLADEGLSVYDIEFITIDVDFEIERLRPVLESAAELGAKRISVCGDDPDHSRLVANFVNLCNQASDFGLSIDVEVMPWRQVCTMQVAEAILREAGRDNAGILVDVLHLSRSGGHPADLRKTPDAFIRSAQLCDATAHRPTETEDIIQEARAGRLAPGDGSLPLHGFLAELPQHANLAVEVPNRGLRPEDHMRNLFDTTQRTLAAYELAESA